MDFNPNANIEADVRSASGGSSGGGGGRGGGIVVGGVGGLILLVLTLLFGGNIGDVLGGSSQSASNQTTVSTTQCKTGADIQTNRECRWSAYVRSIQDFWSSEMTGYTNAPLVTFTGQINTGCGTASSEVGPFYCPNDKTVYIDTSFADQLLQQLGAQSTTLAEAYIVAHEYGHHVQDLTGQMAKAQSGGNQTGPTSNSVRLELQADCYAGVWLHNAVANQDTAGAILTGINQADINSVSDAAQAVGDDRIQQASQGHVSPESWTHGSAKMRHYWLAMGFKTGNPSSCDTFSTNNLGQ